MLLEPNRRRGTVGTRALRWPFRGTTGKGQLRSSAVIAHIGALDKRTTNLVANVAVGDGEKEGQGGTYFARCSPPTAGTTPPTRCKR